MKEKIFCRGNQREISLQGCYHSNDENCNSCQFKFIHLKKYHPQKKSTPKTNIDPIKKWIDPKIVYRDEKSKNPMTQLYLDIKRDNFEKTGNPIYPLEAFIIASEEALYPPAWALSWLIEGFKEYHNSVGAKNLHQLLGFTKRRGQTKLFQEIIYETRNESLCLDIVRLRILFDITIEEACLMVQRRLEEIPEAKPISSKTLKDIYFKWVKTVPRIEDDMKQVYSTWNDRKKKDYLKLYPKDSLRLPRKNHSF